MIFFHAFKCFILQTLKNARNNAWTSQNHAKSLGVLFSPRRKERQLYCLNVWCTVRAESDLRTSKKYFIDVLMFPLSSFWENQLKKKMTFISEIKKKSEELECIIFILSFNLQHQFLHRVYYDLWRFLHFKWKKKNPTLLVHPIYVVHDSRWHNIDPSHDKTWLRCVRRITTQISLRICTVYSNTRFR